VSYEIRELSGSLFPNENKQSENSPNATGKALIGGILYNLAAWTKTSAGGVKYMSLKFTIPDDTKTKPREAVEDTTEDLPF
jgi:uncharacterized protein (DUF736 family)